MSANIAPITSIEIGVVEFDRYLIVSLKNNGILILFTIRIKPITTEMIQGWVNINLTFSLKLDLFSVNKDTPAVHIKIVNGIWKTAVYVTAIEPYKHSTTGIPIKLELDTNMPYSITFDFVLSNLLKKYGKTISVNNCINRHIRIIKKQLSKYSFVMLLVETKDLIIFAGKMILIKSSDSPFCWWLSIILVFLAI